MINEMTEEEQDLYEHRMMVQETKPYITRNGIGAIKVSSQKTGDEQVVNSENIDLSIDSSNGLNSVSVNEPMAIDQHLNKSADFDKMVKILSKPEGLIKTNEFFILNRINEWVLSYEELSIISKLINQHDKLSNEFKGITESMFHFLNDLLQEAQNEIIAESNVQLFAELPFTDYTAE